jgi:D-alanine-D-alanine ligase
MSKIRVAVVFGGRSSEHAISCLTAGSVMAALDPGRYEIVPVGIARDGRWVLASDERLAIEEGCPRSTATDCPWPCRSTRRAAD